jgi:transcriptional regulator with XRE-family HTH domain
MVSNLKTEGLRLSEYRKFKGITQSDFAELIGCSQPNLNKVEKGNIGISSALRSKIFEKFPELNPNWLDKGIGKMTTAIPVTSELSSVDSSLNQDLTARFMSSLNKLEVLIEEGKLSYDSIVLTFRNLRKIVHIQESKIKDLEEDKAFLKSIITSSKNTPFPKTSSQ